MTDLGGEIPPATNGRGLKLRTLGHATIALYRDGEAPLLVTDPWLLGSVYWRSWWLQHYPSDDEIRWLAGAAHVYVTHEHPDHFHMPSIRRLGNGPRYLLPNFPERGYLRHLTERGYRAGLVPPRRWVPVAPDVSILSWPLWNDDSLLLIDTPDAQILNFNDAKPVPPVRHAVRRLADRAGKKRVLLCSYSPASMINSFIDDGAAVTLKRPADYVGYVCRLCDAMGADFYIPFASQASYERADSAWANALRTSFADLQSGWTARARLLPPYATLDLTRFDWGAPRPDAYRPRDPATVATLTAARCTAEARASFGAADLVRLAAKLDRWRWLLWAMFPRGFSFCVGGRSYVYEPRRARLAAADGVVRGDFEIAVPALTLQDALRNDHLTDLGITMMVRIRRFRRVDPRRVYALFILFQVDDYGHVRNLRAFVRWVTAALRNSLPRWLPSPKPQRAGLSRRVVRAQ